MENKNRTSSSPAASDGSDSDEASCLHALELISAFAVSMAVKAAIELGLIDALSMAAGRAMTADELAAQLPATDKAEASASVDRLLRLLVSYNVVKCSSSAETTGPSGEAVRRYTAAPVCRWLTSNSSEGSLAPLAMFAVDEDYLASWHHLGAAVAGGGPAAFERAHGVPMFQYMGTNTRLNRLFNKAMAQQTVMVIGKLLERFNGFDGVSVLVDVGGGTGATLEMITSRYKHISGINFDLPHALSEVPGITGVQHIPGNMFEQVPNGDAIFLKSILHLHNDVDCIKILTNCHRALPEHGKVIALEIVLPEIPEATPLAQNPFRLDVIMLNNFRGGKERTEQEFNKLARDSGFVGQFQSTYIFANYWALEFSK